MSGTAHLEHHFTGDEFWETFRPKEAPAPRLGSYLWSFNDTQGQSPQHVWTIVEDDRGYLTATPGFHIVNVFAHVVTELPWTNPHATGTWWPADIDSWLMTDQPTDCPKCQRRTEYVELGDGRQHHTCRRCGYVFLAESPEYTGEEQCECCREFIPLADLNDDWMCRDCDRGGADGPSEGNQQRSGSRGDGEPHPQS